MGHRALALVMIILGAVIALPTVLIYLFKTPPPLQDVSVIGLSYYKLLFLFTLSAMALLLGTIVSLKAKLPVIATALILTLFCATPLIIGLRHELTMQQAMVQISFFAGWPFFLRPLYLLAIVLLPAGVLLFLALQLRNLFSQEEHTFAFGGAALFLAVAALFSQYELSRAGQPTLLTLLHSRPATESGVVAEERPASSASREEHPALPSMPSQAPAALPPTTATNPPAETTADQAAPQQSAPTVRPEVTDTAATGTDGPDQEAVPHKLAAMLASMDAKVKALVRLQAKSDEKRELELAALGYRLEALTGKLDAILAQLENSPRGQRPQPAGARPSTPATAIPPQPPGTTEAPATTGTAPLTPPPNEIAPPPARETPIPPQAQTRPRAIP